MMKFIFPWSRHCHDYLAIVSSGGGVWLTFTNVENFLKLGVLVSVILFNLQGMRMRRKEEKGYRPPKCEDEERED